MADAFSRPTTDGVEDVGRAFNGTEDFHIGDFDIIHDDDRCCCGTHSATLDGRDIGTVCFFALKSQGRISLWKIQRTPPSEE